MADFRSQRMPSPEGQGNAAGRWRQAWDAYARTVNRVAGPALIPLVEPVAAKSAGRIVEDLVGFWLLWHLEGGFEGLQRLGMSRSGRRIASFRKHFGAHPDEFSFPGVTINLPAYLAAQRPRAVEAGSGKTISVYFKPVGGTWTLKGTATTDSNGCWSRSFTASEDGTWQAKFAGTSNYHRETSHRDYVDVQ